jgi:predicted alpha/beta superfamily hydrolase
MKRLILIWLWVFPILGSAQQIDSLRIHSEIFGTARKILVYTPWNYNHIPGVKLEVIYVFDAQAREYFDCVHSTFSFLNNGQFPMIVVGIVSENRNEDFLPKNKYPETYKHYNGYLGDADKFLTFLSDELMPYIDKHYRTLPRRLAVAHSNGATFLMYSLTQKPDLFDAYIAVSPNWAYDREQPVRRLKKFDSAKILQKKFIYMCNANEGNYWKEWVPAREKAISLLNKLQSAHKIHFDNQDFSASENHRTVFPIAVFYGLKKYLDDQYFNADHLIAYYSALREQKIVTFTPDQLNQTAYDFYFNNRLDDAIKILLWANRLFPENLNLYDSLGEMYQHKGNKSEAMKYYKLFKMKLEQSKESLSEDVYNNLKSGIRNRIEVLKGQH